jgi:transcriptional regulator GlxA family with amidase domain
LYRWSVISADGSPALASNGLPITPTLTLEQAGTPDILFVCGGVKIHDAVDDNMSAMLTQLARRNVMLGGICTGSYALVKAGLMNGYQCAIHWENISALREEFPRVLFTEGLFAVDRDRLTCSGGTAPIDLMLNLTANRYGKTLAAEISEQFILERIRDGAYQQHIPIAARLGFSRKELIEVARLMETHIEETLSFEEIARLVGLSQRQLQRMLPGRHAYPLLFAAALAARARTAVADHHVDHERDSSLRFPVVLSFQQSLPQPVRLFSQQRTASASSLPGCRRRVAVLAGLAAGGG